MNCESVWSQSSTIVSAAGNSGPLNVGNYSHLTVDVFVTALTGTSPTVTFYMERQDLNGNWITLQTSAAITAAGSVSWHSGPGCDNSAHGRIVRLRWTVGGTSPSITFNASIQGKG